jgi:hypothetical protein
MFSVFRPSFEVVKEGRTLNKGLKQTFQASPFGKPRTMIISGLDMTKLI